MLYLNASSGAHKLSAVAISAGLLLISDTTVTFANQFLVNGKRIGPPPLPEEVTPDPSLTGVLRAVIDQYRVYQVGTELLGCFFGGDNALRNLFVEAATEWDAIAPGISISFGRESYQDCSEDAAKPTAAQLRIAFDAHGEYSGNWSRRGTESVAVSLNEPSMNIGDVIDGSLQLTLLKISRASLKAKMLHELGHALGLEHEHASPESACEDEILWDEVVYPALKKPPNNWDRPMVDSQLRQLVRSERLRFTEYDRLSIMHYEISANWLRTGVDSPCYVSGNTSISPTDKIAVAAMYPETQREQEQYLSRLGGLARHLAAELGINSDTASKMETEIERALPVDLRARGLVPDITQCAVTGNILGNQNVTITIQNCKISNEN